MKLMFQEIRLVIQKSTDFAVCCFILYINQCQQLKVTRINPIGELVQFLVYHACMTCGDDGFLQLHNKI